MMPEIVATAWEWIGGAEMALAAMVCWTALAM